MFWAIVATAVAVVAGPAYAAPPSQANGNGPHAPAPRADHGPVIADFEGRSLNLAGDWGDATACLVWRQGGVLECFRTSQELDAYAARLAPEHDALSAPSAPAASGALAPAGAAAAYSSYSCSSALSLFDYSYYGGRQLSFWDRGYWQNLGDYGFDDATSSYIVGGCYAHLAEYPDGGGWWYPGDTSPYHGEQVMYWSWNNRVSSIYIE